MNKIPSPAKAFAQAIEVVGGHNAAAAIVGCTPQRFLYWTKTKKICPSDGAMKLATAANKIWRKEKSDKRITAKMLRPDLY